MNKVENALFELTDMDGLASGKTSVHTLSPNVKLLSTAAYIITVVSFGKYELTRLIPMLLWPVVLYQLAGLSVGTCFYRLRVVLPLVLAVGIFNPFFDRHILFYVGAVGVSGGVVSMVTLLLKGVFCLMASFLLVATTKIDSLCAGLRKLHFPGLLVTLLLLTYRYVGVMTEELAIMTEAYRLRAPGQKGIHISAWGSFLGQLLLRSMDRSQELYASMLLRGYHEHFHYAPYQPVRLRDMAFLAGNILLFLFSRCVDLTQLLGHLVLR